MLIIVLANKEKKKLYENYITYSKLDSRNDCITTGSFYNTHILFVGMILTQFVSLNVIEVPLYVVLVLSNIILILSNFLYILI